MGKKHKPEEIVVKLRQVDVLALAEAGADVAVNYRSCQRHLQTDPGIGRLAT